MIKFSLPRALPGALLLFALLFNALPASAGTTGGINGIVTETGTTTPIAGAKITATSPSQSATTTTDARGHFAFVSLAPDEYTLSLEKTGYAPVSYSGVSVFADAQQTLTIPMHVALRTIASVTSRSGSSLVRPGTTADLYSVNAAQAERTAVLGGGGALNSAYSAIASVPGAYVPANQNGYLQAVHVRGGDASEVGYEFDGIPVNRAFDNYPSGSLSSLGQLELQVYTGATPANAEAQGLAGFINQVIKTGTFPGYATANVSLGTPIFYHSANVEVGGASPDRLFSYYVGIGGYNQDYRYVDQFGGAAYTVGVRPAVRLVPESVGIERHRAAVVLHQRKTERRPQRHARMDLGTGRLRIDQRGQRRQPHDDRQSARRHTAQARLAARRRSAALRQRRDLHHVLELGQRRRLSELDQHGRRLPAILPRRAGL